MDNIQNHRLIKVKFLSPTNLSGERFKIYEPKRSNDDTVKSKTFSYNYGKGETREQAQEILIRNGWNVKGYATEVGENTFFCDNWGEDFKKVNELK